MMKGKGNSNKLDGIPPMPEAAATGHKCSWPCLKNPTEHCAQFEANLIAEIKAKQIERWRDDIKKLSPDVKEEAYYFYEAFQGLCELNALPVKTKKHAGYQLGAREFTLTYSPKWFDDVQARKEMKKAMNRLLKYYDGKIEKLRAVGEVGSNGLSHIHCFYKLEGGVKITDKNFQRAWPYWNPKKPLGRGFEGGHHANVKEESDFLGYIDKDALTAWIDINFPIEVITNEPQEDETP